MIPYNGCCDSGSDHSADHSKHYYKSTGQENVSAP